MRRYQAGDLFKVGTKHFPIRQVFDTYVMVEIEGQLFRYSIVSKAPYADTGTSNYSI
jgi:hypothetical protein